MSWQSGEEELESIRSGEEVASLTLIEFGSFLLCLFLIGRVERDEFVGVPVTTDDENPQIFYLFKLRKG